MLPEISNDTSHHAPILKDAAKNALYYLLDDPNENYQWRINVRMQLAETVKQVRSADIASYDDFRMFDAVRNALYYMIEDPNDRAFEKRSEVRRQLADALELS